MRRHAKIRVTSSDLAFFHWPALRASKKILTSESNFLVNTGPAINFDYLLNLSCPEGDTLPVPGIGHRDRIPVGND